MVQELRSISGSKGNISADMRVVNGPTKAYPAHFFCG